MDPDQDLNPAVFVIDLQDTNKKQILLKKFFFFITFEGTVTSFFKDKKSKRSHKTVSQWIRIRQAQKHVDLVDLVDPDPVDPDPDSDPDPEHWLQAAGSDEFKLTFVLFYYSV
jgi:hypothetical protein